MKSIRRRALAALVFGLLGLGSSSSFARENESEKPHSCCSEAACCGAGSCSRAVKRSESVDSLRNQAYKSKTGRNLPGVATASETSSSDCCNRCC